MPRDNFTACVMAPGLQQCCIAQVLMVLWWNWKDDCSNHASFGVSKFTGIDKGEYLGWIGCWLCTSHLNSLPANPKICLPANQRNTVDDNDHRPD